VRAGQLALELAEAEAPLTADGILAGGVEKADAVAGRQLRHASAGARFPNGGHLPADRSMLPARQSLMADLYRGGVSR
jgi:hypothetical protein